jgi:hypothetical protein
MSWEAWGAPPDDEPELCPICDNTQHTPDRCEVAASEEHSRKHYEGVIALLLQEQERKLTNAYADGRNDEREALTSEPLASMMVRGGCTETQWNNRRGSLHDGKYLIYAVEAPK